MILLTHDQIKIRIEEAIDTDRRLKPISRPLVRCYWPDVVHDYHEAYGYQESNLKLGPPDKEKIPEADEVLWTWLRWPTRPQAMVIRDRSRIYYNGPKSGQNLEWEIVRKINKIGSLTTTKRMFDDGIDTIYRELLRQAKDGEHCNGRLRAIQQVGINYRHYDFTFTQA